MSEVSCGFRVSEDSPKLVAAISAASFSMAAAREGRRYTIGCCSDIAARLVPPGLVSPSGGVVCSGACLTSGSPLLERIVLTNVAVPRSKHEKPMQPVTARIMIIPMGDGSSTGYSPERPVSLCPSMQRQMNARSVRPRFSLLMRLSRRTSQDSQPHKDGTGGYYSCSCRSCYNKEGRLRQHNTVSVQGLFLCVLGRVITKKRGYDSIF